MKLFEPEELELDRRGIQEEVREQRCPVERTVEVLDRRRKGFVRVKRERGKGQGKEREQSSDERSSRMIESEDEELEVVEWQKRCLRFS